MSTWYEKIKSRGIPKRNSKIKNSKTNFKINQTKLKKLKLKTEILDRVQKSIEKTN